MKQPSKRTPTAAGDTPTGPIDLLLQNRGRFLCFLRRSQGRQADLEDVLQDAFVKSLEHGGSLRDSDKTVAWFFRVLRNQLVDRHRQAVRRERTLELVRWQAEAACLGPQWESAHLVEQLVRRLAPRHRETLQALYATGGNLGALAERDGTSINHAAVRACRARRALRKLYQESDAGALWA